MPYKEIYSNQIQDLERLVYQCSEYRRVAFSNIQYALNCMTEKHANKLGHKTVTDAALEYYKSAQSKIEELQKEYCKKYHI